MATWKTIEHSPGSRTEVMLSGNKILVRTRIWDGGTETAPDSLAVSMVCVDCGNPTDTANFLHGLGVKP